MRKILTVFTAALLLLCMAFAVSAQGGITLSGGLAQAGQQVILTVTLQDGITADQVSVVYEYDNQILMPEPDHSQWSVKGTIDDFAEPKDKDTSAMGAWAVSSAKELKGSVCTLAFRVKSGVSFDATDVSCKLTVMNGGKVVGEYTAKAQVVTACSHSYGPWESRDNTSHDRFCTVCNDKQSGVHSWDEGKLTADPDNSNNALMVYTCAVCKGTKSFVIEGADVPATEPEETHSHGQQGNQQENQQQQQGNQQQGNQQGGHTHESTVPVDPFTGVPQDTQPQQGGHTHESTVPVDPFTGLPEGTQPQQEPTQQTPPYVDYNEPEHTHPEDTVPQYIPLDHDHDHSAGGGGDAATPIVIVAAVAVLVGALVFVVKKKW